MKISQPEVAVTSRASLYLEYLQVPHRELVGEEAVPGAGEDVVVGPLSPGLSPQLRTVGGNPPRPLGR